MIFYAGGIPRCSEAFSTVLNLAALQAQKLAPLGLRQFALRTLHFDKERFAKMPQMSYFVIPPA